MKRYKHRLDIRSDRERLFYELKHNNFEELEDDIFADDYLTEFLEDDYSEDSMP